MSQRLESLVPYGAGFNRLQIDQELLKIGKVGLSAAEGVFPDGTPFNIPVEADTPEPFDVPGDVKERLVLLTLPLKRAGMAELAFERSGDASLIRYIAADHEIRDAVLEMENSAQLKVGRLNVRLQLEGEASSAHTALGMVRVVEKRADGRVILDDAYVPPCLDCRVSPRLYDHVKEIHGLLKHRIQALAERVSSPARRAWPRSPISFCCSSATASSRCSRICSRARRCTPSSSIASASRSPARSAPIAP